MMSAIRVIHLLPHDIARGAQTYARALRHLLDGNGAEHRTMTLFASAPVALQADIRLDVRPATPLGTRFDPGAVIRLRQALRELQPDIVVAHGSDSLKYGTLARPPGSRLVYYKIGMADSSLEKGIRRGLHRVLAARADAVAAVSAEAVEEAQSLLRVPADRVVLIPNGRDPEVYRPAVEPGLRRRPRLVSVGHLTPGKRPGLFLDVVRALRERQLDFDAVLVGDGPLLDQLTAEAAEVGADVLGRRDDVPDILARSDVLLLTSLAEGMPGVLIEAGLAGLPALSTDVPGARTVIDHGTTGFVVGRHDVSGLVEAARRLVVDADLRARMGRAARARCEEHFTLEASARRWQSLLEDVGARPLRRP